MAASPDPRSLFAPDETYEPPLLTQYFATIIGTAGGVLAACAINFGSKRPILSGIQKHIAFGVGGGTIAKFLEDYRTNYYAERDAVIRHYIDLHPDDFPAPERKKLKDMFKPWLPIR